jgi:hypothetical protein
MFYYLVEKVGDGTEENTFRPSYDGAFVWNPDHVCLHCNFLIIGLSEQTDTLQPVTDLESACFARNLSVSDVVTWFVGGE